MPLISLILPVLPGLWHPPSITQGILSVQPYSHQTADWMGPKITTITGQDGYAQIGMGLCGLPQVVDV